MPKDIAWMVYVGSGKTQQRKVVYAPSRSEAIRKSGYGSKYGASKVHAKKQ